VEVSHFTDALSVCFFALLGIWAAVVRRHWFLRFATVCVILLITLVLPAYEVIIEFGLQMAVIATGVWLARGRQTWRPRLSLETAMLLMVVVAIVFAVIARLPDFSPATWLGTVGIGVITGCVALICLWMVFGRPQRWVRVAGGAAAISLMLVLLHFGNAVQYTLNSSNRNGWLATFVRYYEVDYIYFWLAWTLKTAAIALTVMLSTLTLARYSGWFDAKAGVPCSLPSRRTVAARIGLCTMFLAIIAPLVYIFYRLLTPPPLPPIDLPSPNGYDLIVAAGRAASPELAPVPWVTVATWPWEKVQSRHALFRPVVLQVKTALNLPCNAPYSLVNGDAARASDASALEMVDSALSVRLYYAHKFGDAEDLADALILYLRYGHAINRGGAELNNLSLFDYDYSCVDFLYRVIGVLNASQCREVAQALLEVDEHRESVAAVARRELLARKNREWDSHFRVLIAQWSGRDPLDTESYLNREAYSMALLRVAAVDFALQAYALDHGRPPDSLRELTPDYLPRIPLDNCSGKALIYRRRGDRYTLYSVGANGVDDGGVTSRPILSGAQSDVTTRGPHGPPRWMRLRDATVEGLKTLWKAAADAAEPVAE
jgi:hypothetical protein